MFLRSVEQSAAGGGFARAIEQMRASGLRAPEILHLFAFKPRVTEHLCRFSEEVMRGPSPLSPGLRELIAAFTSKQNRCPF